MADINQIIKNMLQSNNTNELLETYRSNSVYGTVNDCNALYELTTLIHKDEKREEVWDIILDYIDGNVIDDRIFNYLYDNSISLVSLSHCNLNDKYLIKLSNTYEEAFVTLARRYYFQTEHSVLDFTKLMNKCKFESVFMVIFHDETNVTLKGLILHEIIRNSNYCSEELKRISERILFSKQLFCTNDDNLIRYAVSLNDYILLVSISQNINTPTYILEELLNVSKIKYASKIRQNCLETLKIKKIYKS